MRPPPTALPDPPNGVVREEGPLLRLSRASRRGNTSGPLGEIRPGRLHRGLGGRQGWAGGGQGYEVKLPRELGLRQGA